MLNLQNEGQSNESKHFGKFVSKTTTGPALYDITRWGLAPPSCACITVTS